MGKEIYARSAAEVEKITGINSFTIGNWKRIGKIKKYAKGFKISEILKVKAMPRKQRFDRPPPEHRPSVDGLGQPIVGGSPKLRRDEAEARIKELKVAQLERRLVLLDSVIRCMSKYITNCRQILISLQNSIPILIPEGEHRSLIRSETERQIANALEELAECGKELETMRND